MCIWEPRVLAGRHVLSKGSHGSVSGGAQVGAAPFWVVTWSRVPPGARATTRERQGIPLGPKEMSGSCDHGKESVLPSVHV